ncbi:hypothetical protein ACFYXF_51185 [Streptomyces sp. NPDC002680]|uniref:hypothetical protein n=1 Tax=Streptomyces sp. NPDC002680 TaxID=3364659 RepID=UPI00368EA38E
MTSVDPEPGRILVIRVWFEPGPPDEAFRARIMMTADIESRQQEGRVVSSPEAALEVVSRWLRQMLP